MTEQKGISFTLTMVVVGVILFITAVSVISLSGGVIQSFFGWGTSAQDESGLEADAREACLELVQDVNRDYCEQYVDPDAGDPCGSTQIRQSASHDTTATEQGCNWVDNADDYDMEVQVQGSTIDCGEEGYVLDTGICPAESAQ